MKEFTIENKWYISIFGAVFAVLFVWTLFGPIMYFMERDQTAPEDKTVMFTVSVIMPITLMIVLIAVGKFLPSKGKISSKSIVTDIDGIWYKYLGKNQGLISWALISKAKESNDLKGLSLLDAKGNELITISYRICDFVTLWTIIEDNVDQLKIEFIRNNFSKNIFFHLLKIIVLVAVLMVLAFIGFANFLAGDMGPLVAVIFLSLFFAFLVYVYLKTAIRIKVADYALNLRYLMGEKNISLDQVKKIVILYGYRQQNSLEIETYSANKPFRLDAMVFDVELMHFLLLKMIDSSKRDSGAS